MQKPAAWKLHGVSRVASCRVSLRRSRHEHRLRTRYQACAIRVARRAPPGEVQSGSSSSPETLRAVGRGIAERRRARHHLGQEPSGRRAQRQSPMGVAVGEPQPALSRRTADHRPRIGKTRPPPFTPSRNPSASRRQAPGFPVLLRFVTRCTTYIVTRHNACRCLPRAYPRAPPVAKNLTDAAVRKYAATSKRREIADARTAGLHLVIQPTGAKSWALRFRRPGGRSAKLTLGPVCFAGQELKGEPVIGMPLTLSAARLLAADIHRQRKMGRDVIAEYAADKHRRRVEQAEAGANTFAALARQFIAEHAQPKLRRWRETASVLGLHYPRDGREPVVIRDGLIERWGNKPVNEIDAHLVFSVVDESRRFAIPGRTPATKGLSDARGRLMARRLSKFFSWLVQHRKVATNPCLGGYVPPRGPARDRTLTPEELRWFWLACDQIGQPFGTLVNVLALTGCRREHVRE